MPLLSLSFHHGTTLDDAKRRLDLTVTEARSKFSALIRTTNWSPDRTACTLTGPGFRLDLRVDPTSVHLTGDIPLLSGLLAPGLASTLKQLLQKTFQKQLPP